jgi:hypothetical protein
MMKFEAIKVFKGTNLAKGSSLIGPKMAILSYICSSFYPDLIKLY